VRNFTTDQEVYRTITNLNMSTDISPQDSLCYARKFKEQSG